MRGQGKVFYGWWMVGLCLTINALVAGMTLYAAGLITDAMQREFSTSRAIIMLGMTGHFLVMGLLAPKLSGLMDRISVGSVLMGSAVISGIGYLIISFSPSIWGFVGVYALLIPILTGVTTVLMSPILLSRWFVKYRGTAIGTAALGTQVGGILFPPVIATVFETFGWRVGLQGMGIAMMILIPLLVKFLMVEGPQKLGLLPDGADPNAEDAAAAQARAQASAGYNLSPDTMVRNALRRREFWIVVAAVTFMNGSFGAWLGNIVLFASDVGVPRDRAAMLISTFAMLGMVCSPLVGWLCDKIEIRLILFLQLSLIMVAMLMYAAADSFALLVAATVVFAIPGGGYTALWGSLIGKLYNIHIYARMMGMSSLVSISIGAFSSLIAGWTYDLTGSYRVLFVGLAMLVMIPALTAPLMRVPKDPNQAPAP